MTRAGSSAGQSSGLIIRRSVVRVHPGPLRKARYGGLSLSRLVRRSSKGSPRSQGERPERGTMEHSEQSEREVLSEAADEVLTWLSGLSQSGRS